MREKIEALERVSRGLHLINGDWDEWHKKTLAYSKEYAANLKSKKTFSYDDSGLDALEALGLSEEGVSMDEALETLEKAVVQTGLKPSSGGHLAYIPGGGILSSALGDYLAAVTNEYAGIYYAGPGAVKLENQLIRWMCSLVGYPSTSLGNLPSGGSIANLIAVTTARDKLGIRSSMVEKSVIYLTEQIHHSITKAIRIAGLGDSIIRFISISEDFKMDVAALRSQVESDLDEGLKPFLIVASAGTTDTGVIDPLNEMADVAEEYACWFHVDAAYGGFFILVDSMREKFAGIERSHSVTIDPHKGLFLSYGLGAVLIKDVEALQKSHVYKASYLQDAVELESERSPADLSPELTKHFRGLRLWLSLQLFGIGKFRAGLEEKMLLCRYFYARIQELGFEVGPAPELSVCIYRYPFKEDSNAKNDLLMKSVIEKGRVFLSSTTINGTYWLRLAVLCFRTHLDYIDYCLEDLEEGIKKLN